MKLTKIFLAGLFFVFSVSLISISPLLNNYFFSVHDDTQPARIFEMAKSLKSGHFPVRWVDDLGFGYGYPLFNFYAPLPYYYGAVFNIFGLSAITSAKIMYATGLILSAVFMYFFIFRISGVYAAVTSSILYLFIPYHALDVYVRGAVGEYWAMAFFPLVLIGIYELMTDKNRMEGISIISLGLSAIFLSHNILGFITAIFYSVLILIFFILNKNNIYKSLLFSLCLGIGLSSFFLLPAIFELKYTKVSELTQGGSKFEDHFVTLNQLWDSPWGFGGSAKGESDGMSFKIGKLNLVLGLISLITFLKIRKRIDQNKKIIFLILLSLFLVSIYLTIEGSIWVWKLIPGFAFIQYPWRFIAFITFSLSASVFIIFESIKIQNIQIFAKYRFLISFLIISAAVFINKKYFNPQSLLITDESIYSDTQSLRFNISKISDEYMASDFVVPENLKELSFSNRLSDDVQILESYESAAKKSYLVNSDTDKIIISNIAYFPGFKVYLNLKEIKAENKSGKLSFKIFKGINRLEIILENTPVQSLANTISFFSLFLLVYLSFSKKEIKWLK